MIACTSADHLLLSLIFRGFERAAKVGSSMFDRFDFLSMHICKEFLSIFLGNPRERIIETNS